MAVSLLATMAAVGRAGAQAASQPAGAAAIAGSSTYNPENRRDPFVSLLARGVDARTVSKSTAELSSLATEELTVKGIVMSRGGYVAMVQAPDQRTFIVRANDQLLDGRVKAVTPVDVVISQDVNDPLSNVKYRDVRKPLRALEGQ
jgi:Tfp pilus assembly protein PilP